MIAIKDFEMPVSCFECIFLDVDYDYDLIRCPLVKDFRCKYNWHNVAKYSKKRHWECPLVEVMKNDNNRIDRFLEKA